MARKRGKMALYEAMSKARAKQGYRRTLDTMLDRSKNAQDPVDEKNVPVEKTDDNEKEVPQQKVEMMPTAVGEDTGEAGPAMAVQWWRKPRLVQIHSGRIEFSMPYQVAVALVLGLVLAILVAFQLGRRFYKEPAPESVIGGENSRIDPETESGEPESVAGLAGLESITRRERPEVVNPPRQQDPVEQQSPPATVLAESKKKKANVFILAEYGRRADFEPVILHFRQRGIETEIVNSGSRYFLVTKETYDASGPETEKARQRIKQVGAAYEGQAPSGYETFAPHFFGDAYLKKVN